MNLSRFFAVIGFGAIVGLSIPACSGNVVCQGDACGGQTTTNTATDTNTDTSTAPACGEDGDACSSDDDCCGFCDVYCWSEEEYPVCDDFGTPCASDDECCGYCIDGACVDVF